MLGKTARIWIVLGLPAFLLAPLPAVADEIPGWLPRYDLDIKMDVASGRVEVRQRVTWTNHHKRPTNEIVFNAHAHYAIPDNQVGFLAKMVEILRMAPSEALSFDGPALEVTQAAALGKNVDPVDYRQPPEPRWPGGQERISFKYRQDNPTALVVSLPFDVGPGQSVTIELAFAVKLPQKKGRWGQWNGITTLAQWLPVVAYYDDQGWQPAPFIPWHQPFFNEAGVYSARITLPADQKLACSGAVEETRDLGDGWQQQRIATICARDFALIASDRFQEYAEQAGPVRIRCLALPEHEFYARKMAKDVADALPVYSRWFGPYPYPQFTIVESYFGWNGNECGGLVMIDERMFDMPHAAQAYLDYLVCHEFCHQWWYNVVGTNGYAETWMDEGLATYFSHRLVNQKRGSNNELIEYPGPLKWLPNIRREDFRNYGMLGVVARGEATPIVQPMEKFGHLVNLSAMTYDRGSKVVGMIEERLGEAAFLDFMRLVYKKYQYRILRVADFQHELEDYTGRSWEDFFQNWLYTTGMCDWRVDKVEVRKAQGEGRGLTAESPGEPQADQETGAAEEKAAPAFGPRLLHLPLFSRPRAAHRSVRVVVQLSQTGQCNEPAVLGFQLPGHEGYQVRVPVYPDIPLLEIEELSCAVRSEVTEDEAGKKTTRTRVEILLPERPKQVSIDPDQILIDSNPVNNHWHKCVRWRWTPLYTQVEETDVTEPFDRWSVIVGPWIYGSSYSNPWFTRSPLIGVRAGLYRTQDFFGGAYLAYRTNDRNVVAGVDGVWDHWPIPQTQIGFNAEQSLVTVGSTPIPSSRAVVFGRYVLMQTSSLYLPPFEYVEMFGVAQNRSLPTPNVVPTGADLFNQQRALGLHYHKYYLTPYWDPEGGYALDVSYEGGLPILGASGGFQQLFGQFSFVKYTPDPLGLLEASPYLSWLKRTRWAFRLAGSAALPNNGLFFALGGANSFRGFNLNDRQGSDIWVASAEWRVPIIRDVEWDVIDHFAGVRNVYLAPFYDAGNAYFRGHQVGGPTAHAVGLGLRVDTSLLGLIERMMLRFDVAYTVNANAPVQFWFGVQHPF